ncbi:right-handed parallel beta-helix repeat-containing protein [Candidatus Pacearchaeota archaeon]|nr:right-handed parallel beta-helix repeat-containing protein [Candidatus Pacearchaeota archaeon]
MYDKIIYIDGSKVIAEDGGGDEIDRGVAGIDDVSVLQAAITASTSGSVIFIVSMLAVTGNVPIYLNMNKDLVIDGFNKGGFNFISGYILARYKKTFQGLKFTGTPNASMIATYGESSARFVFRNNYIYNLILAGDSCVDYMNHADISHNVFEKCSKTLGVKGFVTAYESNISYNEFIDCVGRCIVVPKIGDSIISRNRFFDCVARGDYEHLIGVVNNDSDISGCTIDHNTFRWSANPLKYTGGILIGTEFNTTHIIQDITIDHNIMKTDDTYDKMSVGIYGACGIPKIDYLTIDHNIIAGMMAGISYEGGDGLSAIGNLIRRCNEVSILVRNATDFKICVNTIKDANIVNAQHGNCLIALNSSSGGIISENSIYDIIGNAEFAIKENGLSNYNKFRDNQAFADFLLVGEHDDRAV